MEHSMSHFYFLQCRSKWQVGHSMIYHERVLHKLSLYHAIENTVTNKHNQCGIHVHEVHDGKVECKTVYVQWLSCILIGCILYGMVLMEEFSHTSYPWTVNAPSCQNTYMYNESISQPFQSFIHPQITVEDIDTNCFCTSLLHTQIHRPWFSQWQLCSYIPLRVSGAKIF